MKKNQNRKNDQLQQFLGDYLNELRYERNLAENSLESYSRDIESFLSFLSDSAITDLSDVTVENASEFFLFLSRSGLNERSLARYHSSIKGFFSFLVVSGYISKNPIAKTKPPKLKRKLPEVLSPAEIESLIAKTDLETPTGLRDRAIIEVLYACGIRVSELSGMKKNDIFFDEEMIRVIGKGNKQRLVPIGSSAINALNNYLTFGRPIIAKPGGGNTLFVNAKRGVGLARVGIWKIIKQYAELAGLGKRVYPHIFRHSFATHLIEGGANIRAVQEMLGHTDISVTQIYTHIDITYIREVIHQYHPRG